MEKIDTEIRNAERFRRQTWARHVNLAQQTATVEEEIEEFMHKVKEVEERKNRRLSEAAAILGEAQVASAVAEQLR